MLAAVPKNVFNESVALRSSDGLLRKTVKDFVLPSTGAGEFRLFWTIVMPMATPVLATLGILTFLGSWNGFLYPLVMAQEPNMYTLPVGLATFATGQYQADHGMLMAGSVILVVPVLIVFILFQRWITEGIATTGLKG